MTEGELPRYELLRLLGEGSFGVVYLAKDRSRGSQVAIKRIEKKGDQLSREYEVLSELSNSPHCVSMLECFYTKNMSGQVIQNMVFEYMPGNLESLIASTKRKKGSLGPERVRSFMQQLLAGLADVHARGIVHRDLKPENILLRDELLKIADFGSSKFIDRKGKNTPYIVSRYYRAPELLLCCTKYDDRIDVWAAGCIFAEMCTLGPIFRGKSDGDQLFAVLKLLGGLSSDDKAYFKKRIPFNEDMIESFPFFERRQEEVESWVADFPDPAEALDLLTGLLALKPSARLSAKQAAEHPFFDCLKPKTSKTKKRAT